MQTIMNTAKAYIKTNNKQMHKRVASLVEKLNSSNNSIIVAKTIPNSNV